MCLFTEWDKKILIILRLESAVCPQQDIDQSQSRIQSGYSILASHWSGYNTRAALNTFLLLLPGRLDWEFLSSSIALKWLPQLERQPRKYVHLDSVGIIMAANYSQCHFLWMLLNTNTAHFNIHKLIMHSSAIFSCRQVNDTNTLFRDQMSLIIFILMNVSLIQYEQVCVKFY